MSTTPTNHRAGPVHPDSAELDSNPGNAPLQHPAGYEVADFEHIEPVACPCGAAKRAFGEVADYPATLHITEISAAARLHYHKRLTETYLFLECEPGARMQLNDDIIDVKPGMSVVIRPGVRHRAIGQMKVAIFVMPKFDPSDEWFDDAPEN